eukprot:maker-scaffold_11-snap-gene-5.8-mRNA-1 protein AED:0.26 eAED:0.28 QI:405/0/0.5/1/0/0/2/0/154
MAIKRLAAEKKILDKKISSGELKGVSAPDDSKNKLTWLIDLDGPEDSPYVDGKYQIEVEFPSNYPFSKPSVKFLTKVFNPSISEDGEVCLEILTKWKPAIKIVDVLQQMISLLAYPTPESSINNEAAEMFKNDPAKFNETVEEWKNLYAKEGLT